MEREVSLTIEINNRRPVELLDYAQSMAAVGIEYKRFIGNGDNAATPEDVKLYVKDVRKGSIITELVAIAPVAIQFAEHSNTVFEYAKHLKTFLEWLGGKSNEKPALVEKATLQNINEIVEPVAKDQGSQMNIASINVAGNLNIHMSLSSIDANAIQNECRRALEELKEPVTGIHEQVVMYWAQARNQADNAAGDKARIESLYKGDVKVRFTDDALKTKMLYEEPYPFKNAYVVDVAVETVKGRPILYKVTALHDVIPRDE